MRLLYRPKMPRHSEQTYSSWKKPAPYANGCMKPSPAALRSACSKSSKRWPNSLTSSVTASVSGDMPLPSLEMPAGSVKSASAWRDAHSTTASIHCAKLSTIATSITCSQIETEKAIHSRSG